MKRLLITLLAVFMTAACAIGLVACDFDEEHSHEMTHYTATAATCTEDGNIEYWYCDGCGKYFSDEEGNNAVTDVTVAAKGHAWGEWEITSATCEEKGYQTRACSACGKTETEELPLAEHSYGEWQVTEKATCTTDGEQMRTCSVCGHEETKTLPSPGHSNSSTYKCDENYHWQYCTVCGEKLNSEKHTYSNGTCSVCGCAEATGGLSYKTNSDLKSYSVTGIGEAATTKLVIPSSYNGLPVTGIAANAFSGITGLTSVTIPYTVTSIGDNAFGNCSNLAFA